MFKVLTLDNIAVEGLRRFPRSRYEVASEITHPDAILLRSQNMHEMDIPTTVAAVGRAGAGTNNIPIDAMSARGVPVFNAPGANANAVKELTIAGMLIGARNLCQGAEYVASLQETGDALNEAVEAGKKQFAELKPTISLMVPPELVKPLTSVAEQVMTGFVITRDGAELNAELPMPAALVDLATIGGKMLKDVAENGSPGLPGGGLPGGGFPEGELPEGFGDDGDSPF